MRKGHGLSRKRLIAFAAVLVLALAVPGMAFAASFSSAKPAAGSSTTVTKPTVSVIVYDKYKVYGTGSRYMYMDGKSVSFKYAAISGWGWKKQKFTYTPATALTLGTHTVSIKVKNRRGTTYRYSWKFTVADGVAPVTSFNSATNGLSASDNVGVAHTYYRLDGGAPVEGTVVNAAVGSHLLEFWSVDAAGNEEMHKYALVVVAAPAVDPHTFPVDSANLACQGAGCHTPSKYRNNVARLHEETSRTCRCHQNDTSTPVTKSCVACHGTAPEGHDAATHVAIASAVAATDPASCNFSGCHGANSVVTIHRGNCALCHDSADATVKAVIAAGNATCESCHNQGSFDAIHGPNASPTSSVHVGVFTGPTCTATCHPTSAVANHTGFGTGKPGCNACHFKATPPSATCTACHTATQMGAAHSFTHTALQTRSVTSISGSTCTGCHGTEILPVGLVSGEHNGCSCHVYNEVSTSINGCADCHKDAYAAHGFSQTASGHSTDVYGFRGMREFYDGSEGATVLDTRGDALEGEWAIPTSRVFWKPGDPNLPADAYLGADGQGLTAKSVISCRDCHAGIPANVSGPHGAVVLANAGIDPNYPVPYKNAVLSHYQTNVQTFSDGTTATLMPAKSGINYRLTWETTSTADLRVGDNDVICAKCHDLWEENAAGTASADATSAAFFGFANFAHEEHSRFNASGRGDCVNCHVAIPHGWNRPRLLVQTYSGEATQVVNGVETTINVVADPYPYANPRGYWVAGRADNGFASFFPGMTDKRMGLALLPAVWGTNPAPGYTAHGPADHPAVEIGPYGEMTSSFMAPEWQERSSDCMAGCGGSLTRHPKTVQDSFIK